MQARRKVVARCCSASCLRVRGKTRRKHIVRAIIDMGKNLKQRMIAEGIETQEQLTLLQSWRCAEGQGSLFSRPVPAAQFTQLLQLGITESVV